METIAVYWEDKVRTYGFEVKEKLAACRFDLETPRLTEVARCLSQWPETDGAYRWVYALPGNPGHLDLWLICDEAFCPALEAFAERLRRSNPAFVADIHHPVDMVVFQGPHYGDRYGIADFTLNALKTHRIPWLAMNCCISSVSLLLPDRWGQRAKQLLSCVYEIPTTKSPWRGEQG